MSFRVAVVCNETNDGGQIPCGYEVLNCKKYVGGGGRFSTSECELQRMYKENLQIPGRSALSGPVTFFWIVIQKALVFNHSFVRHPVTEHSSRLLLRLQAVPLSILGRKISCPNWCFCGFPQSLHASARTVPQMRPQAVASIHVLYSVLFVNRSVV